MTDTGRRRDEAFPDSEEKTGGPDLGEGLRRRAELLARVDLFAQLDYDTLTQLARYIEPVLVDNGTEVCCQGDPADCLYVVASGTFGVFVSSTGGLEQARLATVRPGEYFGEMALLTGEPRSATVRAECDGEVLRLERGRFLDLLEQRPAVAFPIIATLCRRLRAADEAAAESRWVIGCTIERALAQLSPERRQALLGELGDERGVAMALNILGEIANYGGDYALARSLAEESLVIRRALGDQWAVGSTLNSMAAAALSLGDCVAAYSLYRESLAIWRELGDRWRIAQAMDGLAALAAAQGELERSVRLAGAAAVLRETISAPLPGPLRTVLDRWLEPARKALSREAYDAAWIEGRAMALDRAIAYALEGRPSAPAEANRQVPNQRTHPLSRREQEVAILVARGLTSRHIAAELVISERTAEAHVRNIMNKLGLSTRAQIAVWAVERGLVKDT